MDGEQVLLYDTTLRDGTQGEGISLSVGDKLKITALLDQLGVAYIEGGWPGANPKDDEYFQRVREMPLARSRIAAFGSTCRVGSAPEEDSGLQALLAAGTQVVTLVGKSWTMHVYDVLRTTLEENLRIVRESIAYLKAQGRHVVYDAEHFFDGYQADPAYALSVLRAAVDGGADVIVLCDTRGGTLPWDVERVFGQVRAALPGVRLGIHAHNDSGAAVANSLCAIRAGATHLQGTINGYGERSGNADLSTLIPNLELKMGIRALPPGRLEQLTRVSRTVAAIVNQPLRLDAPYVGQSAFAHKAGIHAAAMRRNPESYQHVDPRLVGNESRILFSELSGKASLLSKAEAMGIALDEAADLQDVLNTTKKLEHSGFSFEGAEASVELLLKRRSRDYQPPFELLDFMVVVEHREVQGVSSQATVKVRVGETEMHTAAEGNGPVDALYNALRKALLPLYPEMDRFHLVDYKVWILDSDKATGATTRVLIDTQNTTHRWTTVGASENIIQASWIALADAVEYGLTIGRSKHKESGDN